MVIMVITYCKRVGIAQYDILDDGDDCLLIVPERDVERVRSTIAAEFLHFGHEVKIESVTSNLPEVSWCQSSPIEYTRDCWKFVRDPWKTMSCDLIGTKWKTSPNGRRKLLSTIGFCELVLNLGVPVLQEYALALIRNSEGASIYTKGDFYNSPLALRMHRELKLFNTRHLDDIKPQPVTQEARDSFALAFKVPIEEQLQIEKALANWKIALTGDVAMHCPRVPSTWEDFGPHPERYL